MCSLYTHTLLYTYVYVNSCVKIYTFSLRLTGNCLRRPLTQFLLYWSPQYPRPPHLEPCLWAVLWFIYCECTYVCSRTKRNCLAANWNVCWLASCFCCCVQQKNHKNSHFRRLGLCRCSQRGWNIYLIKINAQLIVSKMLATFSL